MRWAKIEREHDYGPSLTYPAPYCWMVSTPLSVAYLP